MRGLASAVGGALLIAALFAGWWAIDRVQEHLPGPVNAVIDSVQSAGAPYSGPIIQPLDQATGQVDPLEACPEFAADVRAVEQAVVASATVSSAQAEANNALVTREIERMVDGGDPRSLSSSGVAAALRDQTATLDATASALSGLRFQTGEAQSLATGFATAAGRVSEANRTFIAQNAGTRAQWQEWMQAVGGPMAQADAAAKGFAKCPA